MKLSRNQFEYYLLPFNQRNLDKVTLCVMGRQTFFIKNSLAVQINQMSLFMLLA